MAAPPAAASWRSRGQRNGFYPERAYTALPGRGAREERDIRRGHRLYDYFTAFENGLSDDEVAAEFEVSVKTVERYRQLPRYYDFEGLDDLVIDLRRKRAHLSTIFRAVREDPGYSPFDGLLLLLAISRVIKEDGRVLSGREMRVALRSAFKPKVHADEQVRDLMALTH
ncbi:MAG: hypothetical protein ACE5I4_06125 [Thermoplasmata archaeon]